MIEPSDQPAPEPDPGPDESQGRGRGAETPDPDPGTGGHDLPGEVTATTVAQALDAIGELARQVYAAVSDDSVGWTTTQLHEQALAAQQAINSLGAAQSVRIAQYAQVRDRTRDHRGIGGGDDHVMEFVPDELAPSFAWGPRQADHRVEDALHALEKTPALLDAAGEGSLDPWRIGLVTSELQDAAPSTCRKVEADLLGEGITSWTGARTRRRARAAVHRHEPSAERKAARKRARERINVFRGARVRSRAPRTGTPPYGPRTPTRPMPRWRSWPDRCTRPPPPARPSDSAAPMRCVT